MLAITLTLSNVLGLIRDRLLAVKLPPDQLDSYFAAFRLPDLLTNLVVIGAIAVAFIPIFTEIRTKDEQEAWSAASAILNMVISVLVVGSVILWIFMPQLMPLVVPEFEASKMELTIRLGRLLTLTPILFGVSYLISGILNSFQRFAVYSLAPLIYNLSIIVATVLLADNYGAIGVVVGVLVGAFLHMLIQVPLAYRLGWRWQGTLSIHHPAVKKMGSLMAPRMIGLAAMQLSGIVATAVGSTWVGAIAYFNLANNIQTMPTVVFGNSIATALFPSLSLSAARNDNDSFCRHLAQGIRWVIFLLAPAAVGFIMLRMQIVRLIFGTGYFDWNATKTTADILGWFAVSLVASGLVALLARAFYARQDMKTPMTIALVAACVTIGLSLILPRVLPPIVQIGSDYILHVGEVAALAIAFSIGMAVNAFLLLTTLRKRIALPEAEINRSLVKIILAVFVLAVSVQISKLTIGTLVNLDYGWGVFLQAAVAIILGTTSYFIMAAWLKCTEWRELVEMITKRIPPPNWLKSSSNDLDARN